MATVAQARSYPRPDAAVARAMTMRPKIGSTGPAGRWPSVPSSRIDARKRLSNTRPHITHLPPGQATNADAGACAAASSRSSPPSSSWPRWRLLSRPRPAPRGLCAPTASPVIAPSSGSVVAAESCLSAHRRAQRTFQRPPVPAPAMSCRLATLGRPASRGPSPRRRPPPQPRPGPSRPLRPRRRPRSRAPSRSPSLRPKAARRPPSARRRPLSPASRPRRPPQRVPLRCRVGWWWV